MYVTEQLFDVWLIETFWIANGDERVEYGGKGLLHGRQYGSKKGDNGACSGELFLALGQNICRRYAALQVPCPWILPLPLCWETASDILLIMSR